MKGAGISPNRPLTQAVVIVVLGATLGVAADLALPGGVLSRSAAVLRDLAFLPAIRLWSPLEAQAALERKEVVLIDGRSRAEFEAGHVEGALLLSFESEEELSEERINALGGRSLIIMLGAQETDEARAHAQELAAESGAAAVGTLEGGFEAWQAAGLPVAVARP